MTIAKASSKHQIVIPKIIRIKLKLKPNQKFEIATSKGVIIMKPIEAEINNLFGCAKKSFQKLGGVRKYIINERKKWSK